jgi:small subunit ribosomal protein S18
MRIKPKKIMKRPGSFLPMRKRSCRFCAERVKSIDYKDIKLLELFVRERGGIISTRSTGNCAKHQRKITEEIKKARFLGLMPYIKA